MSELWYFNILCCPDCGEPVEKDVFLCDSCGYRSGQKTPPDLRPDKPRQCKVDFNRVLPENPYMLLQGLNTRPPKVTYDGPRAIRDSAEFMTEISVYCRKKGCVLDLGCGPRDQARSIEYLGHKYVGVDYDNSNADLLVDAHSIPFKSDSFDVVLSYAVLEHLHNPFVAIREVERVLKPGGIYIGSVSQGEPFHGSFFHHTAWGLISLVATMPNMKIKRLWESGDTLFSLSRMGRYPRIIRHLLSGVAILNKRLPWLAPRRTKWPEEKKRIDQIHRAGSLCFVIQKSE